jgi:hypothetical protein
LSWEQAKEKWAELVSTDEGFYISHQVRNGKRTAILAILYDKTKKESDKNKKAVKVFVVYRPNTGQQVQSDHSLFGCIFTSNVVCQSYVFYWSDN